MDIANTNQLSDLSLFNTLSIRPPGSYRRGYQSAEVELLRETWWEAESFADVR